MISKIVLKSFRSFHEETIDDLKRFNFFGGMNRSGKSTIRDAIAMALSGSCRGAEGGRGHDELREIGDKRKWRVSLDWIRPGADGIVVERREGEGPRSAAQEMIAKITGCAPKAASASMYSESLIDMVENDPKKGQQLLLDLAKPSGAFDITDTELQTVILRALEEEISELDLTAIDRLYKVAYAARTEAGRQVKGASTPEVNVPEHLASLSDLDVAGLEVQRARVDKALKKLRGDLLNSQRQLDQDSATDPESVEAEIVEAQELLEEVPDDEEISDQTTHWCHLQAAASTKRPDLLAAVKEANATLASAQAEHDLLANSMGALQELDADGSCPTCMQSIAARYRENAIDSMQTAIDQAQERIEARTTTADKESDALKAIESNAHFKEKLSELEKMETEFCDRRDAVEKLQEKLAEVQKAHDGGTPNESPIGKLEERIETGEGRLVLIDKLIGARQVEAQFASERAAASKRHEDLSYLCAELGSDGIKRTMTTDDSVLKFISLIDEHVEALGFESIDINGAMQRSGPILVSGKSTAMLSTSEKLLAGLVLQVAIAKTTGLNMVIVDNWDNLDAVWSAKAQAVLTASKCQVFVFTVLKDTEDEYRKKAAPINKSKTHRLYHVQLDKKGRSHVDLI